MAIETALDRLVRKVSHRGRPQTKSAVLRRWLFDEIAEARRVGYTLREIERALNGAGFRITYKRLQEYVSCETAYRKTQPVLIRESDPVQAPGSERDPLIRTAEANSDVSVADYHQALPRSDYFK